MSSAPLDLKNHRITYLTCNAGGLHEGQALNYVCLDLKCQERGIICSVCKIQQHEGHRAVPLKLFLADLTAKLTNKTKAINKEEILTAVDTQQTKLLHSLKETVENMAKRVKILEEIAIKTHKRVKERIEAQCFMSENMPKVIESIANGSFFDSEALREECRQMLETIQIRPTTIDVDFKADRVLLDFKSCITGFEASMKKLNTSMNDQLTLIEKTFDKLNAANKVAVQTLTMNFSETIKGKNINLTSENRIATQSLQQTTNENRFVFLDPVLEKDLKTRWAFKVIKSTTYVGIGIGLKKKLEAKLLKSDFTLIGHGAFLVGSTGYSVNSFKKEENNVNKQFAFTTNETIYVELDGEKQTLTFKQKSNNVKLVLNVELPADDEVYAVANLSGKDDAIEILPELDPNEEF